MTPRERIEQFANQFNKVDFQVSQLEKYQAGSLMLALANIAEVAAERDEEIKMVLDGIVILHKRVNHANIRMEM